MLFAPANFFQRSVAERDSPQPAGGISGRVTPLIFRNNRYGKVLDINAKTYENLTRNQKILKIIFKKKEARTYL